LTFVVLLLWSSVVFAMAAVLLLIAEWVSQDDTQDDLKDE